MTDLDKSFYKIETKLYVSVAPKYSLSILEGIKAIHLDPLIMTYYSPVKGVIIAYKNVELLSDPKIAFDSPFAYAWVSVEFIIWRPFKEQVIEGWISLQSPSHIGLLIYNIFNASIKRENIPKNWNFIPGDADDDTRLGTWVDFNDNRLEGKIKFVVDSLQVAGKLISVEGSLLPFYD